MTGSHSGFSRGSALTMQGSWETGQSALSSATSSENCALILAEAKAAIKSRVRSAWRFILLSVLSCLKLFDCLCERVDFMRTVSVRIECFSGD